MGEYEFVVSQIRKTEHMQAETSGKHAFVKEYAQCSVQDGPIETEVIDREVLHAYVASLLAQPELNSPYIPDQFEGPLYFNTLVLVFNLVADVTEGVSFNFMGHSLKWKMEPDPNAKNTPAVWLPSRLAGSALEDQIVTLLVDEIMSDSALNVWWVPDPLERELNEVATRFMVRVVEQMIEQVSVSIMDVNANISIVPEDHGSGRP